MVAGDHSNKCEFLEQARNKKNNFFVSLNPIHIINSKSNFLNIIIFRTGQIQVP